MAETTIKIKPPEQIAEEQKEYSRMETLRSTLMVHRAPYLDTWYEQQRFIDPHLVIWSPSTAGFPDFDDIKITSWPFQAFDDMVAGLQTGITPENQEWHTLEPEDEELKTDEESLEWCHYVNELYKWTFQNSNFYRESPTFYRMAGKYLTAPMFIQEDFKTRCRFTVFPIGAFYCSNNGQGVVDVFIFETRFKLRQIVDLFCKDIMGQEDLSRLGDNLLMAWKDEKQHENPYNIVYCFEPNLNFNPDKAKYDQNFKEYKASFYVRDSGDKRILKVIGYDEFPVPTFRWFRQPTDAYGVDGPGRKVLGDVKELYKSTGMWDTAVEKVIEPPMVAPPAIGQYPMGTTPGFLVSAPGAADKNAGFRPAYQIQPDLKAIQEKRLELKAAIEKSCYSDVFRMLANDDRKQPATATEIMQKIQENYNILAPMYGNFENEWIRPMMRVMFQIFIKQGAIPPPPPQLAGKNLKWNIVSRIAMALKLVETAGYDESLGFLGKAVEVNKEVGDVVDWDEFVRRYFINKNLPAKLIKDPQVVAQIRQQRAQAMQQQQQQEAMPKVAQGVKHLAEAAQSGAGVGNENGGQPQQ